MPITTSVPPQQRKRMIAVGGICNTTIYRVDHVPALPAKLLPTEMRQLVDGMAASALARLHAPIGLDIGGKAPFEVAVSVIGEITALRYARASGSTSTTPPAAAGGALASRTSSASDAAKTLTSEES